VKHAIGVTAAVMLCLIAASAQAADSNAADTLFGKGAVSEQAMSEMRGGTALAFQNANNAGACSECDITAAVVFKDNAFGQASGIITVINNFGINMILQQSTNVTVSIR